MSFDLGDNRSTTAGEKLINEKFPGRHTIIYGDSRQTVPEFKAANPEMWFDLVFIDGCHDYEVAQADLFNMRELSSRDTVAVMDDPWMKFGEGPSRVWNEAIANDVVHQEGLFQDGKRVEALNPPGRRSWALGRYVF